MKARMVHVGELALNESGAFKIGPFGSSLKKTELVASGIPVAGIENVLPNTFVKGFRRFITPAKFDELSDYEILPDDVLVTTMGTIGRAAPAPTDLGRAIFDSHLFRMRVDESRVFPPYLCYALNSDLVASQLARMARGAIMEGLNTTILRECFIPLPELPEQRCIARQLDQADRLRRTRRYALELNDTFLPSAFAELFGEYLTQDCPELLSDVLASPLSNGFFGKASVYGTGVPVIWVDNLYHTVTINMENLRRARVATEQFDTYRVIEGDLLFTRSSLVREGIGQINIVPHLPEPALFECHVIRARVDRVKVNPFYVLGLYRSSFGKAQILRRANTATMTTISQSALEQLPCPLPPLPLQQKFAALVERAERLRAVQREALRQADHQFATLLHGAFNVDDVQALDDRVSAN